MPLARGMARSDYAWRKFTYSEVFEMRKRNEKHGIGILLGLVSILVAVPAPAQVVQATVKINGMI